jgi:putative flavoprotein involved in K+ transport
VGTDEHRDLDLNALTDVGIEIRGRLGTIRDGVAMFSGGLRNHCALADLKMSRLLNTFDEWAAENPIPDDVEASHRFEPTAVEESPPLLINFDRSGIKTIIWATGFRPDYSWLEVPVLDRKAYIRHDGGVVDEAPGMYLMGMQFLRRRKSSLIDGVGDDARDLSAHLASYLAERAAGSPGATQAVG